jgi:hypothetical protein
MFENLPFFRSLIPSLIVFFSLTGIRDNLALMLNVTQFAAGVILSIIVLMMVAMPVAIFARKNIMIIESAAVILAMGLCCAISWLPIELFLLIALVVALMWTDALLKIFKGGGE